VSRLRNSLGITHPASGLTELTSADADYRAMIDIQRFDSGEAAIFEAVGWCGASRTAGPSAGVRRYASVGYAIGRWEGGALLVKFRSTRSVSTARKICSNAGLELKQPNRRAVQALNDC